MELIPVIMIAFALSADAFAVSITNGMCFKDITFLQALKIGTAFGLFQAFMPVIGWFAGSKISSAFETFNGCASFILLTFIAGKMIYSAVRERQQGFVGENKCPKDPLTLKVLFVLAVATSLDAMAAGVALALTNVNIINAAFIIGGITFFVSLAGVYIGKRWGYLLVNTAEIIGGCILILIGVKILLEGFGMR